jgi:hypothetical protein
LGISSNTVHTTKRLYPGVRQISGQGIEAKWSGGVG